MLENDTESKTIETKAGAKEETKKIWAFAWAEES
jgi:hypothetical protein